MRLLAQLTRYSQARVLPGRRKAAVYAGACIVLFGLLAVRASAVVHPVPLDKDVDSKKCLECHEDKTKAKSVHSAMATGCLSCHEVRVNKDITHIKLITATPSALCFTCQPWPAASRQRRQQLPPDRTARARKGQPSCRARHGVRNLPCDAQDRR